MRRHGSVDSTSSACGSPPRARAAAGVRLAKRVVDARQVPLAVRPGTCAIISDPIIQLTYIRTSGSLAISFLELSDHRMKDDLLRSDLHPLPVPSSHASKSTCIPGATRPGALTSPCVDCTRRVVIGGTLPPAPHLTRARRLADHAARAHPPAPAGQRLASPRRPPRRFATDRSRRHVFAARVDPTLSIRLRYSWRSRESPISQISGGHKPTKRARRSALPRSSWSTVLARIHSAMQSPTEPSEKYCMCPARNPESCRRFVNMELVCFTVAARSLAASFGHPYPGSKGLNMVCSVPNG